MSTPPTNQPKDYKELRMIIRSLFAYEMSRNWLIRLVPILAGYWFYRWSQDTILLIAFVIWSCIEIVRALNVFLFQSNIALIQANDFIVNLKKLLGIRPGHLTARHPDSDFSGGDNAKANANSPQKALNAGRILQQHLHTTLGEGPGAAAFAENNKQAIGPTEPKILHFLRLDPHTRHHIYQVDSAEFACKSIADTARIYAKTATATPTANNEAKAAYWAAVNEFVKNDKLTRAGRVKLKITNPEETAEGAAEKKDQ